MKKTKTQLVKEIKNKQKVATKQAISFRFKRERLEKFKKACKKEGVSMTEVLEAYIEEFIKMK